MLKGHVFKEQIFGNQIFALFINTFLDGKNGVSNNYKNGMAITYSGSTLTVQSGAVCIQGRFLEEDTSKDIESGTDTAFCKLVLEIDLSKQNTESEFNQANYKIVKSTSGYPNLTQNDIIKNNTGIYQYELARFKTGTNGITEFRDMRTFLDFESIYKTIEDKIDDIEDGSIYVLKNDKVLLFENEEGTTADITLTDSVSNYKKIEIEYRYRDIWNTSSVYEPNGKTLTLSLDIKVDVTYKSVRHIFKNVIVSNNTIKKVDSGFSEITLDTTVGANLEGNTIAITKVVGYKN